MRSDPVHHLVRWATFAALVCAIASRAAAQNVSDRVRLLRGSDSGEVTAMTPLEVTLNRGSSGNRSIAVNEIKSIAYSGEPTELARARVNSANGNQEKALELLSALDLTAVKRDFIQQDIEFYKAFCAGKLALSGSGEILEAGRQLNAFVRSYPNNFHYLAATELMGDLLVADGRFEPAQKQYAELAKAPWPDYRIRAAVAVGRTLQAQGKNAEAIQQFEAALSVPGEGADALNQKLAATLAKAVSEAEMGRVDEAVRSIEKVIQDTDPEQKELQARAYNALGICYEKAGQTKDALLAFLHVDVLYNTVPEAHAEALAHMVPLWQAIGQAERARETRSLLQERYAGSPAAKAVQ